MKRIFLFILTCFIIITGIYSVTFLPGDTKELIGIKYDNWSGVIRVWITEGTGAAAWLNNCAAAAEKELNGVYINVSEVPSEAIGRYSSTGINPPDIIIYSSSLAADRNHLYPITAAYPLRSGLPQSAYAVPILVYPRFWIHDRGTLPVLPGDMYSVNAACAEADLNALVALSTGMRPAESEGTALPGLDLGLSGNAPVQSAETEGIQCRMNPSLKICGDPYGSFIKGEVSAFIGGITDVLRLSESRDIAVSLTGEYACAYDTLLFSIIDKKDQRTDACLLFLEKIMTHGQSSAARAQAFPAVTGVSAWTGSPFLAYAESAAESLVWIQSTSSPHESSYLYIEGKLTADEAMDAIINTMHTD